MQINGLDEEKCIKCLDCVRECPSSLFIKPPTEIGEKRKVIFEDPYSECIECGHCISVCPTAAVQFDAEDSPIEFDGVKNPADILNYEILKKATQARRSIRQYKNESVPKELIQKVLDVMRYAPSARNDRAWKYVVIEDKEIIEKIRNVVIKALSLLRTVVKYKFILKYFVPSSIRDVVNEPNYKRNLEDFFTKIENDEDPIFYRAPIVIVTYAPELGDLDGNDAGIALTHGMLAAQSLGLGSCWIGYAQESLNHYDKYKPDIGIPKDMHVNGVLTLGYPDVKFKRVPPREKLDVTWV